MTEKEWLGSYTGQSIDQLIALEDRYRTDSLVVTLETGLQKKAHRLGASQLSPDEFLVLIVEEFEREINNGGYAQYFSNCIRENIALVVPMLKRIGCDDAAKLTAVAKAVIEFDAMTSDEQLWAAARNLSDERAVQLSALDENYYECVGDLAPPLFAYIKANRRNYSLPE